MHASQRNLSSRPTPNAAGPGQKSRNTMRLTFVTNGTFFDIQGDIREEGGVNLHLTTDGHSAELSIQCIEEDAALPSPRIFRDHCT
jgi:hypothetical protein